VAWTAKRLALVGTKKLSGRGKPSGTGKSHPEFPIELVAQLRRFEITPGDALRRHQYVESRPRLPGALRRLILYGMACIDMHEDDIRAALGEPSSTAPRGEDGEVWTYPVASRTGALRELEVVLRKRRVIAVTQL
jgi:hypothetical protein